MRIRLSILSLSACFGAQIADAEPVFLLHTVLTDFSACESIETRALRCDDLFVSPSAREDYFVWVLIGDVGGEITSAAFGVEYEAGVNVATWVGCTSQQLPYGGWPSSGSGLSVAWGECHRTGANDMVKVGFFYVTSGSSGRVSIAPHPFSGVTNQGGLATTDCSESTIRACEHNGSVVFEGVGGYVPGGCRCSGPPAVEASWSAIKREYRE